MFDSDSDSNSMNFEEYDLDGEPSAGLSRRLNYRYLLFQTERTERTGTNATSKFGSLKDAMIIA